MKTIINTYKPLVVVLLLLLFILLPTGMRGAGTDWGYEPVYSYNHSYTLSTDNVPSYEFGSTSAYGSVLGSGSFYTRPRKTSTGEWSWDMDDDDDDPEDNPVGVLSDPAPIGEGLFALLFCALLFALLRYKKVQRH